MNRTAIWNRLMKREIPRFDLDRVYYFDEYNKAHNYGEQNITIPGVRDLLMKLEAARNVYTRDIEAMTGTGKTVATKVFLKKIVQNLPKVNFTILDYKQIDFASFAGLPGYYGYDDCVKGLRDYYANFKAQQATKEPGVPHYLIVDEWAAFILAQEKKLAEELKAKLGELLMLGRGFNYHVICGLERADAEHFPHGARDQFHAVLALGNLSKEGKNMLFSRR
ncbi:MAG: hypothetical protein J1E06_05100 [Acutalibacter sp.]|nr:hypothetical protein [Acutalibacter sp.]